MEYMYKQFSEKQKEQNKDRIVTFEHVKTTLGTHGYKLLNKVYTM